jgi:hypothetical protein
MTTMLSEHVIEGVSNWKNRKENEEGGENSDCVVNRDVRKHLQVEGKKRLPLLLSRRPRNNRIYAIRDEKANCQAGSFCERKDESYESYVLTAKHEGVVVQSPEIITTSADTSSSIIIPTIDLPRQDDSEGSALLREPHERKLITRKGEEGSAGNLCSSPSGSKAGTLKRRPTKITINQRRRDATSDKKVSIFTAHAPLPPGIKEKTIPKRPTNPTQAGVNSSLSYRNLSGRDPSNCRTSGGKVTVVCKGCSGDPAPESKAHFSLPEIAQVFSSSSLSEKDEKCSSRKNMGSILTCQRILTSHSATTRTNGDDGFQKSKCNAKSVNGFESESISLKDNSRSTSLQQSRIPFLRKKEVNRGTCTVTTRTDRKDNSNISDAKDSSEGRNVKKKLKFNLKSPRPKATVVAVVNPHVSDASVTTTTFKQTHFTSPEELSVVANSIVELPGVFSHSQKIEWDRDCQTNLEKHGESMSSAQEPRNNHCLNDCSSESVKEETSSSDCDTTSQGNNTSIQLQSEGREKKVDLPQNTVLVFRAGCDGKVDDDEKDGDDTTSLLELNEEEQGYHHPHNCYENLDLDRHAPNGINFCGMDSFPSWTLTRNYCRNNGSDFHLGESVINEGSLEEGRGGNCALGINAYCTKRSGVEVHVEGMSGGVSCNDGKIPFQFMSLGKTQSKKVSLGKEI